MDARKSLAVTSLIGAIPGGVLAFVAAMGGISGATGPLMLGYWLAAAIGLILALLPVLAVTNIWPKTRTAKSNAAGAKSAPDKAATATQEPASEELDIADDEEFAEASDEFTAVSDSEFEFEEADEFDDEDEGK